MDQNRKWRLRTALTTALALGALVTFAACAASGNDTSENDAGTTSDSSARDGAALTDSGGTISDAGQDAVPPLDVGLVALWNFEETAAGTAPGGADFADQSGNGNHGKASGAVTYGAAGVLSKGVGLDGTSAFISIVDTSSLRPANITISVWFNFTTPPVAVVGQNLALLVKPQTGPAPWHSPYQSWMMRLDSTTAIESDIGDSTAYALAPGATGSALAPSTWYQSVLTYDGATIEAYLNGVALGTPGTVFDGGIAYSTDPVIIGADLGIAPETDYFAGTIDQVAIWNRVLTTAELTTLYNSGAGTPLP